MYRCGSAYQDRPCDAGKAGRALGSTGSAAPAGSTASVVDAECAQRGKDSLKIVWSREGGATEERLLSQATSPRERRLIQDVYRRPGAASTVQGAVQADCVAEKQREEQEAALAVAAALKARREGVGAAPAAESPPSRAEPPVQQRADYDPERKKQQCARYDARLDSLRAQERAGGDVRRMEELNEQRRSLRAQMSSAGC